MTRTKTNAAFAAWKTTAALAALLFMAACASSQSRIAQMDADALFRYGQEQLRAEEWSEAVAAFERFALQFPTHARAPEARYNLGLAFMGREEYISAANEFSRLAGDYPAGPWADEARFKVCESYYELSPDAPLDQEYTRGAIDHCESLIAYYPDSEYAERAREIRDRMVERLGEKTFEAGEFYRRRQAIDSAIMYYEMTLADYPESTFAPRALYRLWEAYTDLGYEEEATTSRERLLNEYPDSPQASRLRDSALATGS